MSDAVYEFFNSDFARVFNQYYVEHNAKSLNDISHRKYNGYVQDELKKFLGGKSIRRMTVAEAKVFLHKIKTMPKNHPIGLFNAGVAEEAAVSMQLGLRGLTRKTASGSLLKSLRAGAKKAKKGVPYVATVATAYFFAEDAMANGIPKAIDHEVKDQASTVESIVNYGVKVWERGTIRKYGNKLVELCDISKWW